MPLYEYRCTKCGHVFEKLQTFSARKIKKCPECGGRVEQTITAPTVQFKGSGWYVTDYPKKSGGASSGESAAKDSKESNSKDSSSKESKKEDKKSESTAKESSSKKSEKNK
jgi:putative FmdB family regulatory protein